MGQSTDGIVFYGYIWDDEDAAIDFDLHGAVQATAKARNIPDPWGDKPDDVNHRDWFDSHTAEIEAWRDALKAIDGEFPIDVGQHCSDPYPLPYVYIRSTEITANRGTPMPLTSLDVDPQWKPQLDAFLAECDVEPPEGENQPGWWICSWWG